MLGHDKKEDAYDNLGAIVNMHNYITSSMKSLVKWLRHLVDVVWTSLV